MPIDSRKSTHLQGAVARTFTGRQKSVVFVYQSGGSYSYASVSVIFRQKLVVDPQIATSSGGQPRATVDTLLVAPLGTNFTGVVYIADTATATAPAVLAAPKYEIIEAFPLGIIPEGTRIVAQLRRLR
jgi:hypothetical protein